MRYSLLLLFLIAGAARAEPDKVRFFGESYTWTVSRVVDPEGKVDKAAVDAALRASDKGEFDGCPDARTSVLAWLAFEHGKVALVDLGGTDDRATRACLMNALKRATLANSKAHVVAIVELTPPWRSHKLTSVVVEVGQPGGGPGPRPTAVTVGEAELHSGDADAGVLNRVMQARKGVFRACYQKELNHAPGLAGKLVVQLTIGSDGIVSAVELTSSTMSGGDAVAACVLTNARRLKFPPRPAVVSYPFMFIGAETSPQP